MVELVTRTVDLVDMGKRAKAAAQTLAQLTTEQKNAVILAIADALEAQTKPI